MSDLLLPDKIQETISTSGITDLNLAESIASHFVPFMGEITAETDKLKGLELGNAEHAAIAKRVNIDLGKIRSRKDAVKKTQKEYYLNVGRFIDALANTNEGLITMGQSEAQEHSKYFERMEAERIAKLKAERNEKMSQYSDVELPNLELLSEEVFEKMLSNYKLAHEARIKAQIEAEEQRLENERIEREKQATIKRREEEIKPLYSFFEVPAMQILGDLTEEEFQQKLSEAKQAKSDHEAEQERIRLENIELKRQADEKVEIAKKQQETLIVREKELRPYIQFIRDYPTLISADEKDYKKEFAEIKKGAEDHWEFERKEQLRKAKEEEEKQKEEANRQAEFNRVQKELAAEKQRQADREAAEKKAEEDRLRAEKELLISGDKNRMKTWIDSFIPPTLNADGMADESVILAKEICEKFDSFKSWAVKQVNSL